MPQTETYLQNPRSTPNLTVHFALHLCRRQNASRCDIAILAPLGGVVGVLIGTPLVAFRVLRMSTCPLALNQALALVSGTPRLGAFARGFVQVTIVVAFLALLPPLAFGCGIVLGATHGFYIGWMALYARGACDYTSAPLELWRSSVLQPLSQMLEEWHQFDMNNPMGPDDFPIDVNPLLLCTATVAGLLGAAIMSVVYLGLGLLFIFPMAFKMYRANSKLCGSDFKIIEALFACTAYLIQLPLIPVYAIVLTAWQPLEGLLVGFGRVGWNVIFHSNAAVARGSIGWIFNTLGITGLVPAVRQLSVDIQTRWEDGEKRVTRVYERLIKAQEDTLHCFSAKVTRSSSASSRISTSSRASEDWIESERSIRDESDVEPPSPASPDGAAQRAPPTRLSKVATAAAVVVDADAVFVDGREASSRPRPHRDADDGPIGIEE